MFALMFTLTFSQTLTGPASVTVGDAVFLRLADGVKPLPGIALKVTAPALEVGTVAATTLNLRESPDGTMRGSLFRGDRVLIKGQTGDGWCEVIVAHGGTGFASCEFLDRAPYGQPLGVTDIDGRVVVPGFAVVPGTVTIEGGGASFSVPVLPVVFDHVSVLAPGITGRSRRWIKEGDGPFAMQILEVDPREPNVLLLPVRARDRAVGRATTSSMAQRYGAVAAVNGGPFASDGSSSGAYQLDREVVAGSSAPRSALVRCADASMAIEAPRLAAAVPLTGLNRARSGDDLLLFRPLFGPTTQATGEGVEVVLDAGARVVRVEDGVGNADIPADGAVLSGVGTSSSALRALSVGSLVNVSPALSPLSCDASDVVGAGPRLVVDGRAEVNDEGFGNEGIRLPRTAFGVTSRGTWLLVTVDGRQASSQGMRLDEFAASLVELGAIRAVNLDGGSSTTTAIEDTVRNSPADGPEREVSDAVLLFSVHDLASLRHVMDRVALDPGQIAPSAIEPLYQRYDHAVAAFAAEELDRVRSEVEALRAEVKQRAGGELTRAAARVLSEAASTYLRILPGIQQQLRRRVSAP